MSDKVYDVTVSDMEGHDLELFAVEVDEEFGANELATEMGGKAVAFQALDGTLFSFPSRQVRVTMIPREGK